MMDVYRDNPVTIYNVTGIMGKSFKKVSTWQGFIPYVKVCLMMMINSCPTALTDPPVMWQDQKIHLQAVI
jgi:hypothetical protein